MPRTSPRAPDGATVSLSVGTWVALAGAFVLLLAMFGTMIVLMADQRALISKQERIAARQATHSLPILRTTEALLGDGEGLRRGTRRAGQVLGDLHRAGLPRLGELLSEVLPNLKTLPTLVAIADRTADIAGRTANTLGRSYVTQRESLARVDSSLEVQRQSLTVLRRSLRVQQGTQATALRLLAVAQETLAHVRNIDAKTGGPPVIVPPG